MSNFTEQKAVDKIDKAIINAGYSRSYCVSEGKVCNWSDRTDLEIISVRYCKPQEKVNRIVTYIFGEGPDDVVFNCSESLNNIIDGVL